MVFWSVMDMVLLGGSLAIVLMPLHHRLSARVRQHYSAAIITGVVLIAFLAGAYITLMIFSANAPTLSGMFTSHQDLAQRSGNQSAFLWCTVQQDHPLVHADPGKRFLCGL